MNIIVANYEQWLSMQTPPYSNRTCLNYSFIVSAFLRYLEAWQIQELSHITPEELMRFTHQDRHGTPYAPAYIQKRVTALNLFFNWAYTHRVCSENPIVAYKRGRLKPKQLNEVTPTAPMIPKIFFTEHDLEVLLKESLELTPQEQQADCVIQLVLSTALRPVSLMKLQPDQIDLEHNQISLETEHHETHLITPVDRNWQKSYLAWLELRKQRIMRSPYLNPPLFLSKYAKPLVGQTLHLLIVQYLKSRGIYKKGYHLESLRQTVLVRLFKQGRSIEQIQALTGIQLQPLAKYRQSADAQKLDESLLNKAE